MVSIFFWSHELILVYDVSNRESFEALPRWYSELETYVSNSVVKILVGNKVDKVNITLFLSWSWIDDCFSFAGILKTGTGCWSSTICRTHVYFIHWDLSQDFSRREWSVPRGGGENLGHTWTLGGRKITEYCWWWGWYAWRCADCWVARWSGTEAAWWLFLLKLMHIPQPKWFRFAPFFHSELILDFASIRVVITKIVRQLHFLLIMISKAKASR